jgi:hypothetical protein
MREQREILERDADAARLRRRLGDISPSLAVSDRPSSTFPDLKALLSDLSSI